MLDSLLDSCVTDLFLSCYLLHLNITWSDAVFLNKFILRRNIFIITKKLKITIISLKYKGLFLKQKVGISGNKT